MFSAPLLGAVLMTSLSGCSFFEGRDVGPDADEMAQDPLLHLELADADPQEVHTGTGKEGGLIPAGQSGVSRASRTWYVARETGQEALVAAVDAAAAEGVRFWSLRCSDGSTGFDFSFTGAKEVAVGDDTVVAHVRISLDVEPSDAEPSRSNLSIRLSSDGSRETTDPPGRSRDPVSGDCPAPLVDKFEQVRA